MTSGARRDPGRPKVGRPSARARSFGSRAHPPRPRTHSRSPRFGANMVANLALDVKWARRPAGGAERAPRAGGNLAAWARASTCAAGEQIAREGRKSEGPRRLIQLDGRALGAGGRHPRKAPIQQGRTRILNKHNDRHSRRAGRPAGPARLWPGGALGAACALGATGAQGPDYAAQFCHARTRGRLVRARDFGAG